MRELRYTLLSDGSSDAALMPLLGWLLRANCPHIAIQDTWGDLRHLSPPPRRLAHRISSCADLYPCDLLFVHRDAEGPNQQERLAEIQRALKAVELPLPPTIPAVPVRMMEAWLLFDEAAIRRASGNPHGSEPLALPSLRALERVPDPKQVLHEVLREASGLRGRRRRSLSVSDCARRVAEFIEDWSPLRQLTAFQALEQELLHTVDEQGWR